MYDTAQEIEMIFDCDHDAGADSAGWPREIKRAADMRQKLYERRKAPMTLAQVIDRCEGIGNIFFLSRELKFEPPDGYPCPLSRPEDGGPLESNLVPVASSGSAGSPKAEVET